MEEQSGKAKSAKIHETDGVIRQKTTVVCNNRDVDAALKIAEIEAETVRISTEINAHCDAEIQVINAEKSALQMKLDATTDEINGTAEAKAAEIIARAEGKAAEKMEKYRKFTLGMKKLDMIGALTKNKKTVISGDTANSLLSEVLVADRQRNVMLNVDKLGGKHAEDGGCCQNNNEGCLDLWSD